MVFDRLKNRRVIGTLTAINPKEEEGVELLHIQSNRIITHFSCKDY